MNCHLKFLNKIIKTSFVIQQFSTQIPKLIQLIFGAIAQLQILSYIEQPMYDSISSFTIILFITRPQIYIFSQGNFEIVFILQFFIFQVLLAIWIYLSLLINVNDENNIINQIQYIQQNSKKTELIIQIISIFLFSNKIYIGHNAIEFCLLLILKSNNEPTYLIIFAFLQILQISTILILQWQVLNRSIKFIPILQHLTINQSYTNIFNLFLKFLQTIIYITTTQNALFGQSIIIFITFTHKIFQLEINNILMQNEFQQMIIQFSSLGIVLSLLGISISFDDRISLRLWILILPIFYYIINLLLKREFYSMMFKKNFHQMSISQLKYFSCLLHQGIDFSKQQNKLFIFSYIRRKKFFEETSYITDENINKLTIETITSDMMNQILKILEKLSEKQKNPFKLQQIYINYIQILIIQNKFVEAQTVMEQLFSYKLQGAQKMVSKTIKLMIRAEMNGTQRIYLEIMEDKIIDQIKKKMTQQTSLKTKNHQSISAALKQLSAINSYTIDVQTIFRNVLNYKIDFLNFVQRENLPSKQFSDKVHFTLIEMESLLKKLKQNYNVFPTLQNQSILMIYKVEILNNVFDAYIFSQTIALDEDIFLKHHQSDMFNFFNQSFNFIIFEIHDVQNIQIKYHSITQQNLFQIKEGDQLQSLIPISLKLQHYYMVEHFLQTGKNKYFQAIDESYISIRPGVFCPIDICMDLNHLNTQNIEIITVYRSPQSDKQILFVDSNLKLQEISLHLFDFGFNLDDNQLQFLIGINIQKIIPNFKKYLDDKLFDIKSCPINFMTTFDEQDSKTKSKTYNYLDELEQISFYSCHLNIRKRYYQDEQYFYVLKIDNLKQDRTYSCSQFRMTQNSEPYQEVDEEIEINVPDVDDNEQKYQIVLNTDRLDPQIEILHENQDFRNPEQKITETSFLRINNFNQDAPQSHISSIEEIKKSPYFKTFQLLSSLIHSDKKSKNLISFNLLYFLYIILISTFSIKILVVTYELQDFISHVRLLSIKNEVYQLIESFLLTRYTILSYNILLSQQNISQSEYTELMKFPSSNLLSGFDDLKISISKVLNYPEFQPFLEGNYLTIYLYENTNTGIPYNLSFRSSINLLLEYQYEYKLAYTVKQVLVDSPYFYYSYKNYVKLFYQFVDLQNYTLDQTFDNCATKLQEVFLYFIIFIIITFIISSLKVYHLLQIRIIKNRILTLIKNQEFVQSDQEIYRLKQLQLQIIQKRELVYNYHFDLQNIDTILKKKQKCFKQRQLNQKSIISLRIYCKSFLITFHYLLFLGLSFLFYMIIRIYLQDYQNTALFYQKISDAGVNVLKVYAWKEALYFKTTFTFLNSNEILQIYDEVETSLQSLKDFSINLLNIDEMSYLFGSASEYTFQRLTKESICDNLSDKYYIKAQNICNNIMSGVLKRGLINTLNYIVNSIQIEQQQTNFTTKISYTKLELEGATLVSDIIQQLVDTLKKEFETQTKNLQLGLYIIISLYFSFELLSILFIIRFTKNEEFRLNLLKKFVYLIPAGTLFYDEYFQRALKRIVFN